MSIKSVKNIKETVHTKRSDQKKEFSELVSAAKRGDYDAMQSICHQIVKNVYFSAMYLLRNKMDAEDVAQEVLIRVCEKIHTLKDINAFDAWLNRITVNEARRHISKNSKYSNTINLEDYFENTSEEDEDLLPYEYVVNAENRNIVLKTIYSLPARQREAVLLHYYNNLSVKDTARAMSISSPSVSQYLKMAREKIRQGVELHSSSDAIYSTVSI